MNEERKTLEQRAQMTDIERLRHSASHVLATAILKIWPEAQFAAGPPVENGFYYDVDVSHRISPDDFEKIEAEMKKEIKANHTFEKIEVSRDEALELGRKGRLAGLSERAEPSKYKLDIIENIPPDEKISLYRSGDFIDLCAGPHVMRTGNIGAFKLTNVASAYYKGDEKNPQLQRIYGTSFFSKKDLDAYLHQIEEAKKRDHRVLGKQLDLFSIQELAGPGLIFWHPKGGIIRKEMEDWMREQYLKRGYSLVYTPHVMRKQLWQTSGHEGYYSQNMFDVMELDDYFAMLEEAKKRDHRKLGRELELFVFDDDVGPGLPMFLPRGAVIAEELEKLAKETEFGAGYQRVLTPHIARESLYLKSGHLPYYAESMFPPMELREGAQASSLWGDRGSSLVDSAGETPAGPTDKMSLLQRYYLKAMNCPHHHKLFAALPRSYRDLPLRLAEYGTDYRYEKSGELFGLMRVRILHMNDAHIYCTPEQFETEFNAVNEMYLKYFKLFGIEKYLMRFSTHDPSKLGQKFVDEPELWKQTEEMTRRVLKDSGIDYVEVPNEAAFYGPKIDVQVWSVIGREFTLATNQVDFAQPRSFDLRYKDRDNTEKIPICIHRAPLGTHERFIGFLIEHYAGNFPLWLAPEQVRILTISDDPNLIDYARSILNELRAHQVRAEIDESSEKINGKIQRAEQMKVHTMFVIGKRDMEANAVSVRIHGKGNLGTKPRSEAIAALLESIRNRSS